MSDHTPARRIAVATAALACALVLAPGAARADEAQEYTDINLVRSDVVASGNAKVTVPTEITLVYDRATGYIIGPTAAGFTNDGNVDVWLARVSATMQEGFNAVAKGNAEGKANGVYLRVTRAADIRGAFTLADAVTKAPDGGASVMNWKLAAGEENADLLAFDKASRMYQPADDLAEERKFATLSWLFTTDEQVPLYDDLRDYTVSELQVMSEYLRKLDSKDFATDSVYRHVYDKLLGQEFDFGTFVEGSVLDASTAVKADKHVVAQLVGVCHDDLADGSGKAGLTFLCAHSLPYAYWMNTTNTNLGGWQSSEMRKLVRSGEIYQSLPAELRSIARRVTKRTNNKGGSNPGEAAVTETVDAFWLPSEVEITGSATTVYCKEGTRYEHFVKGALLTGRNLTNSEAKIVAHKGSLSTDYWWLRSPNTNYASSFRYVDSSGSVSSYSASNGYGVCLGFSI